MATKKTFYAYKPYKVLEPGFAKGGNAKVLLVEDENGVKYALKSLKINESSDLKKVKRFLNEIKIVERYQNKIKGVIPIRYKHIPNELKINDFDKLEFSADMTRLELWYVMDIGMPIKLKLGNCNDTEVIIDCLISLSETLSELHKHHIVHRDIKPSNLYYYKESWAYGDFGLVAYPEFDSLTKVGERIGNYATIAPEMRHIKEVDDARPADVWSLAKTLWMLLTNNYEDCFEGLYDSNDDAISIKRYCSDVPISPLEEILKKAIKYNPDDRVNVDEFLELLIDYKECLNERKRIWSWEKLVHMQEKSDEPVLYNSADLSVDTNEIIMNFCVEWESNESEFISNGLNDEVKVLKYIKMKLEHYCKDKFIVSPITKHFRNQSIPAIKVFVKYTMNESKFVTFVLCYNRNVIDFTHGYTLSDFYDMNGDINFSELDAFVNIVENISFKSKSNQK